MFIQRGQGQNGYSVICRNAYFSAESRARSYSVITIQFHTLKFTTQVVEVLRCKYCYQF